MPLTPPGIIGPLVGALAGSGSGLGIAAPQLAAGVAAGIMLWLPALTVVTADVGTVGVGAGVLPCLIPLPLLVAGMQGGFAASAQIGILAPAMALGMAGGLALAFPQGLITTVHPTVGVGTGVATFPGPPAVPFMIAGFRAVGLIGLLTDALATAVGLGLTTAFLSFVVPVPILGAPAPAPSTGVGTGKIL